MKVENLIAGVIVALIIFFGVTWLLPLLGIPGVPAILIGLVALLVGYLVYKHGVTMQ